MTEKKISPAIRRKLVVALDGDTLSHVQDMVDALKPEVKNFKVGMAIYTALGPVVVEMIRARGCNVFLDLKYHDIPSSVARAVAIATRMGVVSINIHASGGHQMMVESLHAAKTAAGTSKAPMLIGVTVLTSMESLADIGVQFELREQVMNLARMSREAGLHGVLASPLEIKAIRSVCGPKFTIMTTGIRLDAKGLDDQRRISGPKQAIHAGADYIVVGRPVTEAKDPAAMARQILKEMS